MKRYLVEFKRIGRSRTVPPLETEAATADDLAEAVYGVARRYLLSGAYEVTVDLAAGTGAIECGRFGRFTVTEVEAEPC